MKGWDCRPTSNFNKMKLKNPTKNTSEMFSSCVGELKTSKNFKKTSVQK